MIIIYTWSLIPHTCVCVYVCVYIHMCDTDTLITLICIYSICMNTHIYLCLYIYEYKPRVIIKLLIIG